LSESFRDRVKFDDAMSRHRPLTAAAEREKGVAEAAECRLINA
jgi:hypothetical protein